MFNYRITIRKALTDASTISGTMTGTSLTVTWVNLSSYFNINLHSTTGSTYYNLDTITSSSSGSKTYQLTTYSVVSGNYYVIGQDLSSTIGNTTSSSFDVDMNDASTISGTMTGTNLTVTWVNLSSKFNINLHSTTGSTYYNLDTITTSSSGTNTYQLTTYNVVSGNYYVIGQDLSSTIGNTTSTSFDVDMTNELASQWETVYNDCITLLTKIFYNTNTNTFKYYMVPFISQPIDLSQSGSTETATVLTTSQQSLYFIIEDESYMYTSGNTGNTGDIGINNNKYFLSIDSGYSIYLNSPYYTLSGSFNSVSSGTEEINITAIGKIYNVISDDSGTNYSVYQGIITKIEDNYDSYDNLAFTCSSWTLIGGSSNNYVKNVSNLIVNQTNNAATNMYFANDNTNVLIITGLTITAADVNINDDNFIVGITGYVDTVSCLNVKNYYYGNITMSINITDASESGPIIYIMNNNLSYTLSNTFVPSTNAEYAPFLAPTIPMSSITSVSDIANMTTSYNYIPNILPGGSYGIVNSTTDYDVYIPSTTQIIMGSDMCRFPWRLSNCLRTTSVDSVIATIAYNAALALYYTATTINENNGISYYINIYDFTNSPGFSGGMVPPLIALIDGLIINGNDNSELSGYASTIKNMGTSSDYSTMYNSISTGQVYPFFDSVNSGGQQLGLAGVSVICTIDFLKSNYNAMRMYDSISTTFTTYNTPQPITAESILDSDTIDNIVKLYNVLCLKGPYFYDYSDWGKQDTTSSYAAQIHNNAYYVNVRIRDINIEQKYELSFGENIQSVTTGSSGFYINDDSGTGTSSYCSQWSGGGYTGMGTYTPTYYPIYSLPDSGWFSGATVEIFSYQLLRSVGMNDYLTFCRLHRFYYYMIFLQNGGDMFDWDDSTTDKITLIGQVDAISSYNYTTSKQNFWIPSYLQNDQSDDVTTSDDDWTSILNNISTDNIYQWPPEYAYSRYGGTEEVPISSTESPKTNIWANRFNPHRGTGTGNPKVQWSRPSYCMGYAPSWVAAGKTTKTWTDDTDVNRPVAEVLNPSYTVIKYLYSATDGDTNILMAYMLAALKWTTKPKISELSSIDYTNGYDCDMCDFNSVDDATDGGFGSGIVQATTILHPNGFDGGTVYSNNINLTNVIGYGVSPPNDNKNSTLANWNYTCDTSGNRVTTWDYIAKSIQRTMISQHGLCDGPYGNFVVNSTYAGSARVPTEGHDTVSESAVHIDYTDPRVYQILKNMTDL